MLTSEALFRYADRYARRQENAGRGTQYPTLRMAAKRFRCALDEIEDAASNYDGDGYMGVAVAVGIPGSGIAAIERKGDWYVEAYI